MDHARAVQRLAGQLDYLFEEEASLRGAPAARLVDRLNREDRMARARAEQPLEKDEWVQRRAGELDDRFTVAQVTEALEIVERRGSATDD
jgi:hypothetical protein